MAERPVFIPNKIGSRFVREVMIDFKWNPGMASSQKKKNVKALHVAAEARGIAPILEVSSKSDDELGKQLSAFNLQINIRDGWTFIENVFQGSKVFEKGGPFQDLYWETPGSARKDTRLRTSGRLVGFHLDDDDYPLMPPTVFYDWLYINALFANRCDLGSLLAKYAGFTDIEFNPEKSVNCQARSCALFVTLYQRKILDECLDSFSTFHSLHKAASQ